MGCRVCISNKLPTGAGAASPTLEIPQVDLGPTVCTASTWAAPGRELRGKGNQCKYRNPDVCFAKSNKVLNL